MCEQGFKSFFVGICLKYTVFQFLFCRFSEWRSRHFISSIDAEHSLLHDFLKQVFHREVNERKSANELLKHLKHSFVTDARQSENKFSAIIETDDLEQLSSLLSRSDINDLEFAEGKHPLNVASQARDSNVCLKILVEPGKADVGKGSRLLATSVGKGSFPTILLSKLTLM